MTPTTKGFGVQPRTGWLIVTCAVIGTLALLISKGPQAPQATPTAKPAAAIPNWDSSDGKSEALRMSQKFMKRQLKAPDSASFPWYSDSDDQIGVTHHGGGRFSVRAYVDAQNSFGAKLRTHYLCQLKDDGGDSWSLISLTTR